MRERLIVALVGMTAAMLALYGIPRAYMLADLVTTYEERKIERAADQLAVVVDERRKNESPVDEAFLGGFLSEAETLTYEPDDGPTVVAGPTPDPADDIVEERALADGGTLTLSRSRDLIDRRISEALVPLILIGLSLTVVAAGFGYVLARRLSRPFGELAEAADRLGTGRFDVDPPHYSIPEAEAIGDALRSSSKRLGELVRREREFASNASHQLRTPITALRLELEDLALWPQTPPEVAEELNRYLPELDRLSSAIDELLGLARGLRLGDAVDVDLNELVADVVERWQPQVEALGHDVNHDDRGPVPARVVPGPVVQILDVLIENAASHGVGPITVSARDAGAYVEIVVGDSGRRTFGNEIFSRGTSRKDGDTGGLGLTIAADLATTMGGYLKLTEDELTTFELMLPGRND
ncbi:HAMP domain-containing protein [Aeromicrobium tamlense]|uniref:histidine kinase n=1 Tax=Aeromicrobium tamlense TaxID=375541 RepID=A0A8I0KL04_9ACTN|nr:histidine kinase dimerization/phospho-acceptor domain-containing protein [Aeromicrobium tamlense]MBD1269498.1 HAMP domain-containing protein [Aeromicrobium tamlense]NYI39848.1 signal transduction histidine kinase [Aeromicrobium tamlense]